MTNFKAIAEEWGLAVALACVAVAAIAWVAKIAIRNPVETMGRAAEVVHKANEDLDRSRKALQEELDRKKETLSVLIKEKEALAIVLEQKIAELAFHRQGAISLPIPYWCKTIDHRFIFANEAWYTLTGLEPGSVIGKDNFQIGLEDKVARDWAKGDELAVKADGELVVIVERAQTGEGSVIPGKAGKWLVKTSKFEGQAFIWGFYIDDRIWNLEDVGHIVVDQSRPIEDMS